MDKLPLTSRSWAIVIAAALIVMIGGLYVVKKKRSDPLPDRLSTPGSEIPINTMDSDVAPMPSGDLGDPIAPSSNDGPPVNFDVPADPVESKPSVAEAAERMPVVWVTETDGKAYSQPGFNMPIVRDLEQWEELLIVETNKENWDRVQDLKGQQFWVQKKIVTIIRPQNLSQPSVAEKKVMDFFTQVAHKEHSDAYVHLSPEWKRELSFDAFVKGYSRTDSLRSEIVNVFELGTDRFQVDVAQEAIEDGNEVNYLGIYTVEKVDGKWYLTSGSLNRQAGPH